MTHYPRGIDLDARAAFWARFWTIICLGFLAFLLHGCGIFSHATAATIGVAGGAALAGPAGLAVGAAAITIGALVGSYMSPAGVSGHYAELGNHHEPPWFLNPWVWIGFAVGVLFAFGVLKYLITFIPGTDTRYREQINSAFRALARGWIVQALLHWWTAGGNKRQQDVPPISQKPKLESKT